MVLMEGPLIQILFILFLPIMSWATPPETIVSPYIENGVLHILGPIESHIYDTLAWPNDQLSTVHTVRLNSYGGNHYWGLAIAKKIQQKGWNTELQEGDVCASACVYLFGVGVERRAHPSAWFGIHGARLGAGYLVEFAQTCLREDTLVENDQCQQLIDDNYQLNLGSTIEAFQLIESAGVSGSLWQTYLSFADDPLWFKRFNFLKKPDWVLGAEQAVEFNLVTTVLSN